MSVPSDRFLVANGLRHHLLAWGERGPVVLLLHGFLEHAHAWDWVAPRLAAAGHRVLALDWRGHGDSEWVGPGGYYHFPDYAADLAGIVRMLGGRAALVGHSMGASAALLYAGVEPERVTALAAVDSLGPPDSSPAEAPSRFTAWLEGVDRVRERGRLARAPENAPSRLRERFPGLPEDAARHLAMHGTRDTEAGRVWKFDPLHQTTSPQPYYATQAREFWRRVSCPVLYVDGSKSPVRLGPSDLTERLATLRARRVTLDGGHHLHLECSEALAALLVDFLAPLRS